MDAHPLVGQGETLAAPFAQPNAEAPFKLGNVVADCSGRNPKLVLCRGKTLMAHHGLEDAEQPQVGWGKGRFGRSQCHTLMFIIVTREIKIFFIVKKGFIRKHSKTSARETQCRAIDTNRNGLICPLWASAPLANRRSHWIGTISKLTSPSWALLMILARNGGPAPASVPAQSAKPPRFSPSAT